MTDVAVMGSLQLTLRAQRETPASRLSSGALHGALIRSIELLDPASAMALDKAQRTPFTCSPLRAPSSEVNLPGSAIGVERGAVITTRIAVLSKAALFLFLETLLNMKRRGHLLALNQSLFEVVSIDFAQLAPSTLALTTYRALAQSGTPDALIMLRFRSPTYFRSGGRVILPSAEPSLVFASYSRRWNDFSDIAFPAMSRDDLQQAIHLEAVRDRAPSNAVLPSGTEQGETGTFVFRIEGSADVRRGMSILARYATYCGTGARTAFGMGETERLE